MAAIRELEANVLRVSFRGDAGEMLARAAEFRSAWLLDSGAGGEYGQASVLVLAEEPVALWPGMEGDPLERVRAHLAERRMPKDSRWPFLGGLVGYVGYDARGLFEALPERHPRRTALPDVAFFAAGVMALRDEASSETVVVWVSDPNDREGARARREQAFELRAKLESREEIPPVPAIPPESRPPNPVLRPSKARHLERITRALAHLRAGDIYQVNLAQCWEAEAPPDPISFYRQLRALNPPTFGAFLRLAGECVFSISPERFLTFNSGLVRTRPIKGTRPRSRDPDEDHRLARELQTSTKDRAELAMIVDILRNDLSRVCRPGSVKVPRPMALESHPTVHHLVADIEGLLADGRDVVDLLRATMPGGSVTGAPRIRAMELIDALEDGRRGPYCGALGYLGYDGRMDFNVMIRTAFTGGGRLFFHGGGGIVVDSSPESEYEETLHKVRAFLVALEGGETL